jgi:subtilisin family serine protease
MLMLFKLKSKQNTFNPILNHLKMKFNKPFFISAAIALTLSSCSPKLAPMVGTNPSNIDQKPLKTSPVKEDDLKRWSHLDLVKDTIPGMSVDKAYAELLKGKKGNKVIVGIIDSGVDIDHEDLKGKIWTNKKEIAGNNKDDDNNGFIDDVHGWNFLGDSNDENLELTRIVKKGDDGSAIYKTAKAELEKKLAEMNEQKPTVDMLAKADKDIRTHLKKEVYTADELKKITTTDAALNQSKMIMMSVAAQAGPNFQADIKEYIDQVYGMLNYNLNVNFDGRKPVGDNPNDINDKKYGNGNVKGPKVEDALHGTHVAGIVAQARSNQKGGDGVANNVEIMAVRAVPNGDENDKDIALAIRYAVDNGAKVINGSFGKDYSPQKEWVWDAIKYAASKDVLIVHASGNDGKNIDSEPNFPSDEKNNVEFANNFLSIGALNKEYGGNIIASFSNYGNVNVDIFSPGNEIYATVPNNKYRYLQGTSMASPNAAGVAALIRSYYPSLTAAQVKKIIMDSGTPITTTVVVGEQKTSMPFANTCVSGKIVNAYNALLMAEKMSKK